MLFSDRQGQPGGGMHSALDIRVLGDLQVLRDGAPVELPPSRKARALLAYLAVVERPQRRERLCEMFWDVPDDPRGALRWSLSRIRGILNDGAPDLFTADRNTVAVNPAAIRTDLASVRALLAGGADALDSDALGSVADSFRGGFLEDLSLPRCPEFEAWRISFVNEMDLLRLDVLKRLVDRLKDEPDRALPYAHQLQRLLPDEPGLPRLVASLAEAARRRSASGVPTFDPARPPETAGPAGPAEIRQTATPAPLRPQDADVRFCTTRDGVRIAYAASGEGQPLVRAAHWMSHLVDDMTSPVWRHWIASLSDGFTLVRYDERGNGLSQREVDDLSFEAMLADLESIIEASGHRQVVLLGVSQSCAISVAYAVRHPERVQGLILYGGYVKGWRARGNPSEMALREAMATLMREGWGKDDPMFRQLFTSLFIPGATREQMDDFNELQRRTIDAEVAWRLQDSFSRIDVSDLLRQVGVPTLVIHARGDRVAPLEQGRDLAAGIRGARFVELDSENHILLENEPAFDRFLSEIRRFAAGLANRPTPSADHANTKHPVTVLVADIVSPLHAFDTVDPEIAAAAIDPVIRAIGRIAAAHGGEVLDDREGTVVVAFGATSALEQHCVRACRAARAIRDAAPSFADGTVKVRIGIDSGEALVQSAADGRIRIVGAMVKAATRLAGALRRDTVALTARARESAGGFVTAVRMHRSDSPGLARDETVFELLAENKALSRWYLRSAQGLTPLIGRAGELERLASAWQAARNGQGAAIAIVANPGVGKSRLAHEFVGSDALKGFALVEAGAEELDGSAAYALLKRVLLSFFGLDEDETAEAIARTVRRRLSSLGLAASLLTPLLFVLDAPSPDPEWQAAQAADKARRIREASSVLFGASAEGRPLVLLVEDLHWADRESVKVLEALIAAAPGRRILIVLTYRPGIHPPWSPSAVDEIRLSPLRPDDCRAIVGSMLGEDPSVEAIGRLICERADGVPLFIEEIVGALVQSRRLEGRPGGMRLARPTGHLDIPASVQSVIAARIDTLDPPDRNLLQIAAVVGPVVPAALLRGLSGLGPAFDAAVSRLKDAELLYSGSSGSETEYAFKHALIHDATYASLTAERRRALHAATLAALEKGQAPGPSDQVERLAHHAIRAENYERATTYFIAAADRAIERSAYPAAATFLEHAIAAIVRLPESRETAALGIDVRTRMRIAYMVTGDFEKAIARLTEAQEIARYTDDPGRLSYALLHTSYVYSTYGRVEEALAVAEEARAIGALIGDDRYVAEGDLAAAQAHMIRGDAIPSLICLEPHVERFTDSAADDRLGFLVTRSVWFLGSLGSTRALLGDDEDAARDLAAAARLAEETGRPIDRYAAAYFGSLREILAGPDDAGLERLGAMVEDCRDRSPFPFHPWLAATYGHELLKAGRFDEAIRALEGAFDAAEQANMPHFMTYAAAIAAVAHARRGDAGAREDLVDALRTARESRDRWIEIEVLAALADTDPDGAGDDQLAMAAEVAESAGYAGLERWIAGMRARRGGRAA